MEHNRDKFSNEKGLSLVELLMVISIIVIISTLAIMSLGSSKDQMIRQTVARELKVAFERARFDSVKRRAPKDDLLDIDEQANVVVTENSFTLKTDINQNGTLEAAEDRVNTSWNSIISIRDESGAPLTSPITVAFDKRGEITTTGGTAAFLVCNGDCSTTRNVNNSNLVIVTMTGTVNILPGGATAPTFAAPGVTSVPSNANIQSMVTIN